MRQSPIETGGGLGETVGASETGTQADNRSKMSSGKEKFVFMISPLNPDVLY
jgi:hypothetical protein